MFPSPPPPNPPMFITPYSTLGGFLLADYIILYDITESERLMKQNMCVTIDEEIHSWLKNKNEMMSRLVNRILWKAMQIEIQQRALKSGEQTTLPKELFEHRCHTCERHQTSWQNWCMNRSCRDHGQEIQVLH